MEHGLERAAGARQAYGPVSYFGGRADAVSGKQDRRQPEAIRKAFARALDRVDAELLVLKFNIDGVDYPYFANKEDDATKRLKYQIKSLLHRTGQTDKTDKTDKMSGLSTVSYRGTSPDSRIGRTRQTEYVRVVRRGGDDTRGFLSRFSLAAGRISAVTAAAVRYLE